MQTATNLLSDFRQGKLSIQSIRADAASTCNDQVTVSNWSVELSEGQLVGAVEIAPNSGYGFALLLTALASQDQSQVYTAQITAIPGSSITESVSNLLWTNTYPGGPGSTVTGVILGLVNTPDGGLCTIDFQQEFQV